VGVCAVETKLRQQAGPCAGVLRVGEVDLRVGEADLVALAQAERDGLIQ